MRPTAGATICCIDSHRGPGAGRRGARLWYSPRPDSHRQHYGGQGTPEKRSFFDMSHLDHTFVGTFRPYSAVVWSASSVRNAWPNLFRCASPNALGNLHFPAAVVNTAARCAARPCRCPAVAESSRLHDDRHQFDYGIASPAVPRKSDCFVLRSAPSKHASMFPFSAEVVVTDASSD